MFGLFRRRPAPEAEAAAESVASSSRPAERIGADGLTVRESTARRWLNLGLGDLDDAIAAAVAQVVRAHGGGTDGEVTAAEIAERITAAAVGYVRRGGAARHRIDAATITADPALGAFLAAVQGDGDPWPRLLAEARGNRSGAVRRWRQIGAGLLGC